MRFSSRSHYGLLAMVALARDYPRGPTSLAEIARSECIPVGYLEQLMARLRRAGLVESTRGVRGGYRLVAEPSRVTVGQVVRTLEGAIAPAECASEARDAASCYREMACPSRAFWATLRDRVSEVLDATTLADLCSAEKRAIPASSGRKE